MTLEPRYQMSRARWQWSVGQALLFSNYICFLLNVASMEKLVHETQAATGCDWCCQSETEHWIQTHFYELYRNLALEAGRLKRDKTDVD